MVKNIDVEGLHWDITLRELITTFQYSSSIQLEITRPLDPQNLKANLRFDEERRYNDVKRSLDSGQLVVQQEDGNIVHLKQIKKDLKPDKINSNSIDDLLSQARKQNDLQGQNEGELPVQPNGNFEAQDIRRFCRVCNMELPSISNYQAHRRGKKHLKRQADFEKTGKFADDIQVALARGETLWQKAGQVNGGSVKPVKQTPMQREMKKLIENQPLDKFCPICGITLSSPVVCLSHYVGKNHLKKAKNAEFSNQQDVINRISQLVKSLQEAQNRTSSDGGLNETFKRARHRETQAAFRRDYTAEYNRRTEELGQRRKLPPRQSSFVTENGLRAQRKTYGRIFNEPNPTGDDDEDIKPHVKKEQIKREFEDGEVDENDEVVEDGSEEEEIVQDGFHGRIKSLYQKNETL